MHDTNNNLPRFQNNLIDQHKIKHCIHKSFFTAIRYARTELLMVKHTVTIGIKIYVRACDGWESADREGCGIVFSLIFIYKAVMSTQKER